MVIILMALCTKAAYFVTDFEIESQAACNYVQGLVRAFSCPKLQLVVKLTSYQNRMLTTPKQGLKTKEYKRRESVQKQDKLVIQVLSEVLANLHRKAGKTTLIFAERLKHANEHLTSRDEHGY